MSSLRSPTFREIHAADLRAPSRSWSAAEAVRATARPRPRREGRPAYEEDPDLAPLPRREVPLSRFAEA